MRRNLIKWIILGLVVGVSGGVLGNYKLLKHETRSVDGQGPIELRVKETKKINENNSVLEETALIKEINLEGRLFYDNVSLEKDEIYVETFVFDKSENMVLKEMNYLTLNDEILGQSLNINGKIYGVLNSLEPGINIYNDSLVSEHTGKSEKVDCYLIKAKILENGTLKEIKKEKKSLDEFLKYNKVNKNRSDLHEYEDNYKNKIDVEKIKKEVSKKEAFYEIEENEIFNSEGRYYFLELFNKNMDITYVLGDRKENIIYTRKSENKNISIKGGFLHENEIYLLERKGDILKIKEDKKTVKVVDEYKNDKRNMSANEFNLIGIEGDNVYFRNSIPLDSLMSFNLKEKTFNVVYDSKFNTMENMDMKDGYITLYENPKESNKRMIGLLKDGEIDIKIKGIDILKDSVMKIYKDKVVLISIGVNEKSKKEETKIKIFKL